MHTQSLFQMGAFIFRYLNRDEKLKILDVGSMDLGDGGNNYRNYLVCPNWEYNGLDIGPGKNVDIVSKDPYHFPVADGTYDVVISGQVMEHVEDIYAWIKEIARVLKPGGIVCIIVPCGWGEHRHPVDCWRVYPDGMRFILTKVAGLKEEKIYCESPDTVGIARKM